MKRIKTINQMTIKEIAQNAHKWNRYFGYPHGHCGGINIPTGIAMECARLVEQKSNQSTYGQHEIISKRKSGTFLRKYEINTFLIRGIKNFKIKNDRVVWFDFNEKIEL